MDPAERRREPPLVWLFAEHPAVWSVPLMVLLVLAAWPFNEGFYEFWVNYDTAGAEQESESAHTERMFEYTSGVLCGQFLALLAGAAVARRHLQAAALAVAVPLGGLLAGLTFAVAYPLATAGDNAYLARYLINPPLNDPVLVRLTLPHPPAMSKSSAAARTSAGHPGHPAGLAPPRSSQLHWRDNKPQDRVNSAPTVILGAAISLMLGRPDAGKDASSGVDRHVGEEHSCRNGESAFSGLW
jgi:hypothetical protein